jgi:endonuclease YncB( thermonuclease family)
VHDHAKVRRRILTVVLLAGLVAWAFLLHQRDRRNDDADVAVSDGTAPPTTAPASGSTPGPGSTPGNGDEATVRRVEDGDSFVAVLGSGREVDVRMLGINAPERGECLADEARRALTDRLGAGPVVLEPDVTDRDRFGRLLRYVVAGGTLVELDLVGQGLALATSTPPDTAHQPKIDDAQARARAAGVGLWNRDACGPAASTALRITRVDEDPPGRDEQHLDDELAVIANTGAAPVDMTGWRLRDDSTSNRYAFPDGFTLAAGAQVVVHVGAGGDTATGLHWDRGQPVWDNDRDLALLLDPHGNIVSALDVPRGR